MCGDFLLLSLASYCFPAPSWVVCGMKSLWGCPCSSVGPPWPTEPQGHPSYIRIASFHDNISSHVFNNVLFHVSLCCFFFSQRNLFTHFLRDHLLCVLLCFLSLSPFCTSCPQLLPLFLRHAWSEAWSAPLAGMKV